MMLLFSVFAQNECMLVYFSPDNSLTVNNIPDISVTCFKFPDISRFSRQVVTLLVADSSSLQFLSTLQLPSTRQCAQRVHMESDAGGRNTGENRQHLVQLL